jgi:hypothetical protein
LAWRGKVRLAIGRECVNQPLKGALPIERKTDRVYGAMSKSIREVVELAGVRVCDFDAPVKFRRLLVRW